MLQITSRVLFTASAAALAAFALAGAARAHEYTEIQGKTRIPLLKQQNPNVDPLSAIVVPLNGKVQIEIADAGTCTATLTGAPISGADHFTVSANPAAAVQSFKYTITGTSIGVGTVQFHVVGAGGNCNENSLNNFFVVVVDPKTAEKQFTAILKSELLTIKSGMKSSVTQFANELAGHLDDVFSGAVSPGTALDLIEEDLNLALFFCSDLEETSIANVYAAARTILLSTGYGSLLAPFPLAFSSGCSAYGDFRDAMCAEAEKTYMTLKKIRNAGIGKILLKSGGSLILDSTTSPPHAPPSVALGVAPAPPAPKQPLEISQVTSLFIPELGSRTITVRGRADSTTGATVHVVVNGPPDSNGARAYTQSFDPTIDSDGKWEVVYQNSAISKGTGEVKATHATEARTKAFTSN